MFLRAGKLRPANRATTVLHEPLRIASVRTHTGLTGLTMPHITICGESNARDPASGSDSAVDSFTKHLTP